MVPRPGDVEQRHEVCGLSRGCQHGRRSALQGADLRRHGVIGGILEPGIEIAFGFQVKELSHVLAGVIAERRALHNGDLPGFSVPWAIARLYTFGALSHICILPVLCSCADACSQARKIKKRLPQDESRASWYHLNSQASACLEEITVPAVPPFLADCSRAMFTGSLADPFTVQILSGAQGFGYSSVPRIWFIIADDRQDGIPVLVDENGTKKITAIKGFHIISHNVAIILPQGFCIL